MTVRTEQKALLQKIFNDKYHRRVTSPFAIQQNPRKYKHDGVDYGANIGEGLYPIHDKIEVTRVIKNVNQNFTRSTGTQKDFGNYVMYYVPAYDVTLLYAHLNKVAVSTGEYGYVKLGESGNTGLSLGPHLHLGIAKGRHTALSTLRNEAINFETWSIPSEKPKKKEVDSEVVNDVILGKYGNGEERVKKLKEAGYDPKEVQDAVNRSYGAKPKAKPKPKPKFKTYQMTLPAGSRLYDAKGNAYDLPTTKKHTVTIRKENGNLGLIRESWLKGVNEAWVKLPSKSSSTIKRGDKIKIKAGAKDLNKNIKFASWVYNTPMYVLEVQKRGYVFSDKKHGGVLGVVGRNHVVKV